MPRLLRIHSDRALLPEGIPPVPLLLPWWVQAGPADDPSSDRYRRYHEEAGQRFELVATPEHADLVIAPCEWHPENQTVQRAVLAALEQARRAGKPSAVFYNHDDERPTALAATRVFRASLRASRRVMNEEAMPAWSEDLLTHHAGGCLPPSSATARPRVTFCGLADERRASRVRAALRAWLRPGAPVSGAVIRGRALQALRRCAEIEPHFLVRDRFWGGAVARGRLEPATAALRRGEFAANLLSGDYALCVRGAGNFSYRLFEALSLGRIPVFVNTDCVLPFERWIDWRSIAVWVEERDLPRIGAAVTAHRRRLTPEALVAQQAANRRVWEDWLSPHGFFRQLHRFFPEL